MAEQKTYTPNELLWALRFAEGAVDIPNIEIEAETEAAIVRRRAAFEQADQTMQLFYDRHPDLAPTKTEQLEEPMMIKVTPQRGILKTGTMIQLFTMGYQIGFLQSKIYPEQNIDPEVVAINMATKMGVIGFLHEIAQGDVRPSKRPK